MIISKLTNKARTTIPKSVRIALHLKEGDKIAYAIEKDRVILIKAQPAASDDPFATFSEWDGLEDRKDYRKL